MSNRNSGSAAGGLLVAVAVIAAAAVAVGIYAAWDTGRDIEREKAHARALAGMRSELKKTRDELHSAKEEVAKIGKENSKLEAAARVPRLEKPAAIEPPRIITKREFSETEYDETLKRAMFENPRIEAEKMEERPVILTEEETELKADKPVPPPQPIERATGLNAGGKYELDAREMAASGALARAEAYHRANPNADKAAVAQKYKEVASKFPGTIAGQAAARKAKELLKRDK
jgi:hypothetical protein